MQRWKLTIEYDGRPFVGWQRQDNGASIQQALEEAVFRLTGEERRLTVAGRTDAGVHALGQVAHLDLDKVFASGDKLQAALNAHLRQAPISILKAVPVSADFNARFDAVYRRYRYHIFNRRAPLTWQAGLVWQVPYALDYTAMAQAASLLIGHHDFTSFRASQCQAKHAMRTLDVFDFEKRDELLIIRAEARSFLHHQVRNMVGTLVEIGRGRWSAAAMAEMLQARDRAQAGPTAPPDGLYFHSVDYA